MKRILLLISALALVAAGCGQKPATNTANSSSSPTTSGSPKAPAKANEKKPPSTNPVPSDWVRMFDDAKGYEFYVPQGTKDHSQTVNGVDVYLATVPAPYEIGIIVVALVGGWFGGQLFPRVEGRKRKRRFSSYA